MASVPSPCIGVCVLNAEDHCEGCYRSADEITRWGALDDARRRAVLENTVARMRAAGVLFEAPAPRAEAPPRLAAEGRQDD
ncbi:MAG: hypothetical protein RLZZ174_871 [Pseudomonadota bacterium]|nr:DUF1289 domain-containing protein [Pseudomonadales bacterium]MBL6808765.1 DUF1289 domain-containing protein [Pseudomonadales bacterium]MDA0954800.1 DUF1289 domain-containing protein [Pseudomonadota bacterium]